MSLFSKFKSKLSSKDYEIPSDDGTYVEIDPAANSVQENKKVTVRPFILTTFESVKPVVDSLRLGSVIALVNIRPLKEADLVELKRAVNKIKKTCDAIEGDIAGFGEDWIAVTPSFAHVHRPPKAPAKKRPSDDDFEAF